MITIELPEHHLDLDPQPGFGRLISIDPTDKNFPMSAEAPLEVTRSCWMWETPLPPLDQEQTSECTAFSAEHLLLSAPSQNAMYLDPHELYRLNQLNDEWEIPGESENPAGYKGSSVRAAMKVLQAAGFFETYVWAFDADTARRFVLMKGPVVFGINWYSGMMKPDANGFIRPTGNAVGGHAIMSRGADDNVLCTDGSRGAFRMFNSWGASWGDQGKAWISYSDMDGLIKDHGECAAPTELLNTTPIIITGKIPDK